MCIGLYGYELVAEGQLLMLSSYLFLNESKASLSP